MTANRSLFALSAAALTLLVTGCGVGNFHAPTPVATATPLSVRSLQGTVFGGQQPINGATVQIYAAATTGYGAAATPVGASVLTNSHGGFDYGTITCTTGTYLYISSTGGNPGAGTNTNVSLFTALGLCDNVNSIASVAINEVTTVGSAYALGAFMSGPTNLGTSATNTAGLGLAFADVNELVNITTGVPSGPGLPTGATLPVAEINTLADAVAACVNTTGGASTSATPCGTFFTASTQGGTVPNDTITAILNIVHYPGSVDIPTIYSSVTATSPFQPTLAASPNDFTLAVNYAPSGLVNPSGIAFDSTGIAYLSDKGASHVFELAHSGTATTVTTSTGATAFTSVALEASNNAFSTNNKAGVGAIQHFATPTYDQALPFNGPSDVAIDQNGLVWITYASGNALTQSDAGVDTFANFTGAGIVSPLGIAISSK